tara:strand:+ start:693 stop:1679 length:987 start_codon:yes stop_codon:yes gene_type:complete
MAAQKKLTQADLVKKKANTKQTQGGIRTNVSVSKTQKEYYQKFVNLAVNEKPLPQGDGIIRISPFDDYFLFTIFDEIDGEDTPIDLSNVGDIFINFIGTTDEVDIMNHTQVAEVDLSQGEVLFRITRSDSKKVLALDNNNFYISTKMVSPLDGSISDESILYQGIWLAFDDASRVTLTSQIEEQRLAYSDELARLKLENDALKEDNKQLVDSAGEDTLTIQALQNSNDELTNELAELLKNVKSPIANPGPTNRKAKEAQRLADQQKKKRQQIRAIRESTVAQQTASTNPGFWRNAAANLQNFTIGANPITTTSRPGSIKPPARDNNIL